MFSKKYKVSYRNKAVTVKAYNIDEAIIKAYRLMGEACEFCEFYDFLAHRSIKII